MVSWINTPRDLHTYYTNENAVCIEIDDTYEKVNNVPGLKTSLYPHQRPIVKAMLDLETTRSFDVIMPDGYTKKTIVTAGVLSEAVGSGKTIDILSLILIQKYPSSIPDIIDIQMHEPIYTANTTHTSIVRKQYFNILNPTIVFAGVSVINQWVNTIKTFTDLKFFAVFDVRDLQKLIDIMINKQVNQYDIIIVKNGKITRPVSLPTDIMLENKNDHTINYIYNIITNMRTFCWSRCVIDDFDTISLPHNAGIIPCNFMWYISSTKRCMKNRHLCNNQFKTTADMLMYSDYSCSDIMKNTILFKCANIRNKASFVVNTNTISSVKFYVYVFKNINNIYIGLLGAMGSNSSLQIMEMLNGDAMTEAAEQIGIKSTKVVDIFEKILGTEYTKYKKATNVLEFIKEIEPMQGIRLPMSENPNDDDTYKKSDLYNRRPIMYNYPNLKTLIETTKTEYIEIKRSSSFAIERVKSNITTGECPICLSDLVDENIVILKCCSVILCGMCCFSSVFKIGTSIGTCCNCRKNLNLTNLIYLNSEFDLSKIVEEKCDYISEDSKCDDEKKVIEVRTKNTAIIEIIKGIIPAERKCVDVNMINLMKGLNDLPDLSYNKVLIFANYDETIKQVNLLLTQEKIKFWRLGGSHREIDDTVRLFTEYKGTCTLIINSTKHCAGLNLQTATDLIFTHRIIDPNIETQVIGRGQRLGRTTTLRVHYVMYQNEYDSMLKSRLIRVL
jgi:SNF2 family DNA or RNA helicase